MFGCKVGPALPWMCAGTSLTHLYGALGYPAAVSAQGPRHHQPAPLGKMPMQGPGEKNSLRKTELEMDLWGPGWRHGMEQGGQPSCWLGHLYKATAEGTLLGDAVLEWLGAARLWTDLGAGLTGVISQLGPCQVISASPHLWKPKSGTGISLGTRGVLGGPECKGMDANSQMPGVGTLDPAPAASFKLFKNQHYPLPHISEKKVTIPTSGLGSKRPEMAVAALLLPGAKRDD